MTFISRIPAFIDILRSATGRRRAGLAFATGSVMALTMPPFNIFPLLWLCLPALIFLLQGTTKKRQAFATGWCFAFGFLGWSLYWIAASMLIDIKHFWWAIPLSVAVLPACFALYYAVAAMLARRIGLSGISGAMTFGILWFLADEARGHGFGGFPWNLVGYAWSGVLPVLQSTSVIGIYGLTLLTIVAAALPASLTTKTKAAQIACACGVALFVLMAIGGEARLLSTPVGDVPDVRLRIVQPNTDQARKWLMTERENDFQQLLDMTSAPAEQPITHVIWPETASTYYLSEDDFHRAEIGQHIPASGAVITGVIRRSLDQTGKTQFFNSLVAVDGLGRLVAGYDKVHLVPFGEFMPLRKYNPIPAVAVDTADFTPGDGPHSVRVLGLPPFSALICYESIFSGDIIDKTDRPEWIINVTNDAWYGQTIGPYQHFAIARVRAIEEGIPLIRAANTGISGVIDPLGRIKTQLGLGTRGILDSNLPASLSSTPFEHWGHLPVFLILVIFIAISRILKRK